MRALDFAALACAILLLPSRSSAQIPPGHAGPRVPLPSLAAPTLRRRLGVDIAGALLQSPLPEERQRGFERLGSVGTAQALDLLLKVFDNGGAARSATDRLVAVRALAPHAALPAVRELLVRVMVGVGSNPERPEAIDGLIEHAAALALAAAGDDAALTTLGKAVRQPGHVADTARDALLAFPPRNLSPILQGRSAPTRALASLLGELGDPRAIPALREIVQSAPQDVRPDAALSLAALGVRETVDLARHWLGPENSGELKIAAARILLQFHAPDAASAVRQLLQDEQTRDSGVELAQSSSLPALVPSLIALARGATGEQRSALFAALGLAGTREAVSFLGGALGARETSSAAALSLAISSSEEADSVLEQALGVASTRRAAVRASIARSIALGRVPSGLQAALRALPGSRDASDRAALFEATAALTPERTSAWLKRASVTEVRALARAALLPEVARALAERLAGEQNESLREALAACLVSTRAAESVPTDVLLALIEARGLGAPLAARALAARDSRALRPKILSLLASDDALLRSHVALGLGQSEDESALGVLERAYRFETDDAVRLAIVRAVAARREPAKLRVLGLARALDGSSRVRQAAALALARAEPAQDEHGPQSAWLDFTVRERATGSVAAALVISAGGLALPAFADPDGVLLVPALPTGPFLLRLAAPTRTDDAPELRPP